MDVLSDFHYWTRQQLLPALIITARSDEYLWETQLWLGNNGIYTAGLFMRPAYDHRSDVEVKFDLLQQIIHNWGYAPIKAWDDNPEICRMYQVSGIETVLVKPLPKIGAVK